MSFLIISKIEVKQNQCNPRLVQLEIFLICFYLGLVAFAIIISRSERNRIA